ncbi:MAG: flagellar FlbD family protein [Oscillospiraceae bacterium]|jgi:flagellar protein FlbD|nr:flagellar FlbD family protein [Oscillospiraceae bacterium]
MITLTKIGGKEILINEDLIETAYETPDTVVVMNNGHTYIVAERLTDIIERAADFKRGTRRRYRSCDGKGADN